MRILSIPIILASVAMPFLISIVSPILERKFKPKTLAIMNCVSLLIPLASITYLTLQADLSEGFIDPPYFTHPLIGTFTMLVDSLSAPVVLSLIHISEPTRPY